MSFIDLYCQSNNEGLSLYIFKWPHPLESFRPALRHGQIFLPTGHPMEVLRPYTFMDIIVSIKNRPRDIQYSLWGQLKITKSQLFPIRRNSQHFHLNLYKNLESQILNANLDILFILTLKFNSALHSFVPGFHRAKSIRQLTPHCFTVVQTIVHDVPTTLLFVWMAGIFVDEKKFWCWFGYIFRWFLNFDTTLHWSETLRCSLISVYLTT